MKKGWEYREFEECIVKVPKQKQIKSKDYLLSGNYPVVSQEQELISGYYNDESYVYKHSKPVVVFGDHTKNIKYIDFDFVVGADGTQILMTIEKIETKFFYYALKSIKLENLGYARHYKLLKKMEIGFPNIPEQRRIVSYLDSSFDLIDKIKENASKSLSEAKALFQSALAEAMEPKEGWEEKTLGEISTLVNNINWKKDVKSYNYIDLTSVDRDTSSITNTMLVNNKNAPSRAKQIVKKGDILFATTRPTLKRVAIIDEHHDNDICSTGFCVIRPIKNSVLPKFVFYVLKNEDFYYYIEPLQTGASYPAVTNNIVKQYRCYIPTDIKVQQQIVSRLDSLTSKVRAIEEKYQKMIAECDALKQAMLREVFELKVKNNIYGRNGYKTKENRPQTI